ncbi:MAG: carbohydrate kinase [Verrucomicrobiales bacterium]|nr:carbohydrate kinase [Verrucomicrobiales bacterium]
MNPPFTLPLSRVRALLRAGSRRRVLVVGDVLLDQFIWGDVRRISPEAPVPVVDFQRESFMAGGAANVARNLTALGSQAQLFGVVGTDQAAGHLAEILAHDGVDCRGLSAVEDRPTGLKTRVIAHQQHVVRIDRERRAPLAPQAAERLMTRIVRALSGVDAVVVGDYAKGVVNQDLLDRLKKECRARAVWLSEDPKPANGLDLSGLSLITPNRKEAFELAGMDEAGHAENPLADRPLLDVAASLLAKLKPAVLLITLGSQGMLLCQREKKPYWIPTVAQEVFDVSGAGDTVIASFTLAVVAGASPIEAAIFSNHAAGVVVGKMGTATVTPDELLRSFAPTASSARRRTRL